MTLPIQPQPSTQVSVQPPAGSPVAVISKTAKQQARSAAYTWVAGAGIIVPAILEFIGKIEPQLKALFPKHAETVGPLCQIIGGIGILMLASQRTGSISSEVAVKAHDGENPAP